MSAITVDGLKSYIQTHCFLKSTEEIINFINFFTSEDDREYFFRLLMESAK